MSLALTKYQFDSEMHGEALNGQRARSLSKLQGSLSDTRANN
jgi:hypothetical protein